MRFFSSSLLPFPLLGLIGLSVPARAADPKPEPALPYYASLKFAETNLRVGPGKDYPISWVYHRKSLPVQVVDAHKEWRSVIDPFGDKGWVAQNQVSTARAAITLQEGSLLRSNPSTEAGPLARIDPGVVARIVSCTGDWCQIETTGHRGWIERRALWGVSRDELIGE